MYAGGLEAAVDSRASFAGQAPSDVAPDPGPTYSHSAVADSAVSAATEPRSITGTPLLRNRRRQLVAVLELVGVDTLAVGAAFAIAFLSRFGIDRNGQIRWVDLMSAFALPAVWILLAALNGAYDLRFTGAGTTEYGRVFRTFLHATVVTAVVSFAARLELARGFILLALPLALILTWCGRCLARARLQRMRRVGDAMNRVIAVGSADSVRALACSMRADISAGLHVVGACLPTEQLHDVGVRAELLKAGVPVLGDTAAVRAAAVRFEAASIAVVAGDVGTDALRWISWDLEGTDADLLVFSGLPEVSGHRVHVQTVAGLPLLRVDQPLLRGFRHVLKAVFDRAVAACALVMLAPVFVAIAMLVRLTSRGPAFFLQTRVGRHGRPFRMIKFRSMHVDADKQLPTLVHRNEADGTVLFKMRTDPRVTRVGRVLRKFSLDELPQLLNVLTGSMSLVGPRPPLPHEVEKYEQKVHRRLLVKPGLTGLWQVSGRSDLPWDEAVRLDLSYVENWSFVLDMVIVARTIRAVCKGTGAY